VQVEIDRLALGLRLAGEHERLEPVMRRLRALAGGRLQDALARIDLGTLAGAVVASDGEMVFIERLAVDCSANTAWDDDAIAAHLARRLALALQARVTDPLVLRFRDRAEYVAAALVAFADGQASRCWWFDELDGLQHLSKSAALRTLVISEDDAGVAALARLTEGALTRVLGALGGGDGARLLAWVGHRARDAPVPVAALWQGSIYLSEQGDQAGWLRAIIAAEQAVAGTAGAAALRCLRSFVGLRRLAHEGSLGQPTADPRTWLHRALRQHGLDAQWLTAAPEAVVSTLVAELAALAAAAPRQGPTSSWLETQEGGFFVLLGRVHGRGWLQVWQALARTHGDLMPPDEADALCRALACQVVARALAGPHAAHVLNDGAVQAACAVADAAGCVARHQAVACAALRSVLRGRAVAVAPAGRLAHTVPERHHRAFMRLLAEAAAVLLADCAQALPGLAASSPGFLRSQALAMRASLQISPDLVMVRLARAPLDVLLVLGGVKRVRVELPGTAPLQLTEDHGA